jgi:hypothetical protein
MRQFAQPSEVGEPIELLRAGALFHARGLINRAVHFNLDWVWPYWIERQFNPADESFVPRAFSFSHINLTHRNWTAVGLPGVDLYPIVDPRGLVTPFFDGWSLDFWIVNDAGEPLLLPSNSYQCEQRLEVNDNLRVLTRIAGAHELASEVVMELERDTPCCVIRVRVSGGKLVAAVRPYNPEGISFVDSISVENEREWLVNKTQRVRFNAAPERVAMSCYEGGDVLNQFQRAEKRDSISCRVGMATAGAMFSREIEVRVPLEAGESRGSRHARTSRWPDERNACAKLEIPNARWKELYDIAVSTLILHSPHEVYPGPYTYKRFWYRDAAFILNALASIGAHERCRRMIDLFPRGQLSDGYFRSQEGEWDSNGEVLWILERCFALSGEALPDEWLDRIERAARWIVNKRIRQGRHTGLFPAGFSAEHLGLNDFYYWDDFWGVAGLRAAAKLLHSSRPEAAAKFQQEAADFLDSIEKAITKSKWPIENIIPAAPDRRMDSGAIGSIVADYPTQLFAPGDARIMNTVEWLMAHSFFRGGFFQEMIHSGINAYLTLHVAQALLRAGDSRAHELIDAVARLASPTGQWPEAIHPRTLGGCMGDGQHVWAAAEWVMMMRHLFVMEEGNRVVIGAGLPREWLQMQARISFGPAATRYGPVTVRLEPAGENIVLELQPQWRGTEPELDLRVRGFKVATRNGNRFTLVPN